MTLRKLEIYYTVAEKLSMTVAAKELYISQPSISQVIRELEEDMEVKLFQRIGRKLYLTEEGRVFKGYALRMLNLYRESQEVIRDMRELKKGSIKVGASTTIGTYLLPDIVADFKRMHPQVDIDLFIDNTHIISTELLKNHVDIAFVEGPVYEEEIEKRKMWDDKMVFISSPESSWGEQIDKEEISRNTLILREKGSGSREVYENFMGKERRRDTFVFGSTEAIKRAVKKGIGVACVSALAIRDEVARGELRVSEVEGIEIRRDLNLIYHKDKEFSGLIEAFLKFSGSYIEKKGAQ